MSNIFFISDMHIGHANVIRYSSRPFSSVEDMNEQLIKNWNSVVKPEDIVYNLGDFSFQKYSEFKTTLRRLNGKINLIFGNHDKMIVQNQRELLDLKLLNSVQYYCEFKHNKQHFVLLHFGMRVWNRSHHGSIHLYGHSHNSLPPHGLSVDVGVDSTQIVCAAGPQGKKVASEYRPIHLDEIIAYMSKREKTVVDHHGMKDDD